MRKKWTKYTRRFHETLEYKKPMDVYQESIKLMLRLYKFVLHHPKTSDNFLKFLI
jgi:hypothetical protein